MTHPSRSTDLIALFLCGDVMTGRGVDQILLHPSHAAIHEPYIKDAGNYVRLAEAVSGPIPWPVDPAYIWEDPLDVLESARPDFRVINLETSVTRSDDYWKGKDIHYRMHPENIGCITAAGIDVCSLVNNHVLDWSYSGLEETLETLAKAMIKSAGTGMNLREAQAPTVTEIVGKGRVALFAFGSPTSGIPRSYAVSEKGPGVDLLRDFSEKTIRSIREMVR